MAPRSVVAFNRLGATGRHGGAKGADATCASFDASRDIRAVAVATPSRAPRRRDAARMRRDGEGTHTWKT